MMKVRTQKLLCMLCALALLVGLLPLGVSAATAPKTCVWGAESDFFTVSGSRKGATSAAPYNGVTYTEGLKLQGSAKIEFTVPDGESGTFTMVIQSTSSDEDASGFNLDGTFISLPPKGTLKVYTNSELASGKHTVTAGEKEATVFYLEWVLSHEHQWKLTGETPATCTKPGTKTYTCEAANCPIGTKTEETELAPHKEVKVPQQDPTCGKEGHAAWSYCSECKAVLSGVQDGELIPATGLHTRGEGDRCTVCGKQLPPEHEHVFAKQVTADDPSIVTVLHLHRAGQGPGGLHRQAGRHGALRRDGGGRHFRHRPPVGPDGGRQGSHLHRGRLEGV